MREKASPYDRGGTRKMKKRLDILITERGLAPSREKARALIMEGAVFADGNREDKPGTAFSEDVSIEIRGNRLPYVSRGGLKLEKAINVFAIDLAGRICMDTGCSTGGFTDCMLQNGAEKVYAVDVGYGQLDWKLRTDARVVCMEKTNARYLKPEDIPEQPDFISADVSFISLTKILPALHSLAKAGAEAVLLIKPQFEAGREKVGKKGVVRDPKIHEEVIGKIIGFASDNGWIPLDLSFSPVKGPEGNIEYLFYLKKECLPDDQEKDSKDWGSKIRETVRTAHETLSRSAS